jgi:exportin-1
VAENFMVHLMEPILDDYARSIPAARNMEVLSLVTTAVNKLREHMAPHVPRVMGTLFGSTLDMIKADFKEHPETRSNFYKMLLALVKHNFAAVFSLPPDTQKATVDSFRWAIKHPQRDIADLGLSSLHCLFEHVASNPAMAQPFYKAYLTIILSDLLYVLTDRMHKSAFKMHCVMLRSICRLVERGQVAVPLFAEGTPDMNNQRYLREFIGNLVLTTFSHLSHAQVMTFVVGLFDESKDDGAYKTHLRDFLISLKEFSAEDNAALYADEAAAAQAAAAKAEMERRRAVPGLVAPHQGDDDQLDEL